MLRPWTAQGVRFFQRQITPENLGSELAKHLSAGDLLIDLAWNIDCCEILAVVPRPRRALRQHVGRGVGPLRRRRRQAPHRADALLAAHEHPPHDGRLERAGPDGRGRARRQSRA